MTDLNYSTWSDKAAQKDAALGDGKDSVEIMKLKEGRTVLRFLPPQSGKPSPLEIVWQHYVETQQDTRIVFPCPLKMHRLNCPVCGEANRLSRTGNPADREMAYQLWPKMRVFAEIIDMEDTGKGVQILAFGKMIYEGLMSVRTDSRLGGDFTDPEDGFEIIIDRAGSGKFDTKYAVRSDKLNASPIEDFDWLEQRHDLERFSTAPPAHTLEDARLAIGLGPSDVIDAETVPQLTARTISDDIGEMD